MRTNETAFSWLPEISGNQARRDYPMLEDSLILAMTDFIWSPPHREDTSHRHNCMEIGLCLEGEGFLYTAGAEKRPLNPGCVVIVPESVPHCQIHVGQTSARWRFIAVNEARLTNDAPARCRIEIGRLIRRIGTGVVLPAEHPMTGDVAWLIQRMFDVRCAYAQEATAELEAIILLILTRIARDPEINVAIRRDPDTAVRTIDPALLFVAESYHQDIKVGQMARACAMSESHFRKSFLELMGVSPLEYVNHYRIKRAEYLLQTTEYPVSRIAEDCGFLSIATFNRNFIRYTGFTPSQWRNKRIDKR